MMGSSHNTQQVLRPLCVFPMLFGMNSWIHWILNHPIASLFPGLCIYFYAILGKSKAVGCYWISLEIWSTEWREPRAHDISQGCVCPHSSYATGHLSFPQLPPKSVTWTFSSFLLLFHCFLSHIFNPPNSCLPYSLRQGCKIPSTLICRVIICKWRNAQTKWTKAKNGTDCIT